MIPTDEIRHLVVVDTETTGLDPGRHTVVEVAWWDLTSGECGCFVPVHDWRRVIAFADLKALQTNRYVERLAGAPQDVDGSAAGALHAALTGHTLAGANPAFDARFIKLLFDSLGLLDPRPWHHRLWDVSAFAAGVLGLPELPGLSRVCELLDIPGGDHTAAGDVEATGRCLTELQARAAAKAALDPVTANASSASGVTS